MHVFTHEVARAVSPNGAFAAVLTESNGGATTSFGYNVSVGSATTTKPTRVASLYGAVRNSQAYGVDLHWTNEHTLHIQYCKAEAVSNVLTSANIDGQHIEIVLDSGVEDSKAPPGGMLFNLQKHSH
jgi:hypothetical protein